MSQLAWILQDIKRSFRNSRRGGPVNRNICLLSIDEILVARSPYTRGELRIFQSPRNMKKYEENMEKYEENMKKYEGIMEDV